ncbi:hypothetical protein BUALT_Bualt11G0061700 [Buddleja alternifolia]|uniref:Uncharacterized protein n=1 Tax=Buddleja alternifolia TaxID=168488 RepID=A0AAV6X0Z0_9LAMI|nr:hypothetical protein BUALT_Bualt11G0061700 [Buddleja alternifolia]
MKIPPTLAEKMEHLQKVVRNMEKRMTRNKLGMKKGILFSDEVMADELPTHFRMLDIPEYNGFTNPVEHPWRFQNFALLHHYTDGVKCRIFLTTLAGVAQQCFNQLALE